MSSTPSPTPGPRPAPPGSATAPDQPLPELPDAEQLAALTIREHVALFEDLQRVLADRLDDTGA